jgi:hypothetical protein
MKNSKCFSFILLHLLILPSTFSLDLREAHSFQKQTLSAQAYVDPKGFFTIFPPSGWRVWEYPKDPRGKVAFIHPDINNLDLRIIAQAAGYSSFEELAENTEMRAKQIRPQLNAQVSIQRTSLGDAPALRITVTIPGQLKQLQFQFLRGGMYYNIAYGAPIYAYEDFLTIVTQSIATFEPTLRDVTQKNVIRHQVSGKVRRATLLIQMGKLEDALKAVNEGLQIAPSNSKLKELKRLIEKSKK